MPKLSHEMIAAGDWSAHNEQPFSISVLFHVLQATAMSLLADPETEPVWCRPRAGGDLVGGAVMLSRDTGSSPD
jgi:hypothetical protein